MMRRPSISTIASLAFTILLLSVGALAQQSPRELYERARMLDESNQNLNEAIKLYSQVVTLAREQHALAARAQYQIGLLYLRLGKKSDALKAFNAVVTRYPDQTDLERRARAKLAAAGAGKKPAEDFPITRAGPSPDGRYLATFTFPAKKGLGLSRPLADPAAHRLFIVTQTEGELGSDAASKRAEQKGLRQAYERSTLIVIDTDENSVVKTLPLPVYLAGVAFNPANHKLYGAAQADRHIRIIDTGTFTQTTIPLPGYPSSIALNSATNKIYATSQGFAGNDKLFVIDGATNAVAGPFDLDGVASYPLVVNSATNRVYVSTQEKNKTRVFNGTDNSVLADLPAVHIFEVDPVHNRLYVVTSFTGEPGLQVLDANSHGLISNLGLAGGNGAVDPTIDRLYVLDYDRKQIAVIDTATNAELGRLSLPGRPTQLTIDRTMARAYLCHYEGAGEGANSVLSVMAKRALEEGSEEFFDGFDAPTLGPAWAVVNGSGSYSLTENPGYLRLRAAAPSGATPRLLFVREFRGDYWTFETKVSYFTGTSGGGRSLDFGVAFGAPPNVFFDAHLRTMTDGVYVSRKRRDWDDCCPGETWLNFIENNASTENSLAPNPADAYVWRIKRNGRMVTVERSDDGIDFTPVGTHTFGPQINNVIQYLGISYDTHANNDAYADYDYVRLTKATSNQH